MGNVCGSGGKNSVGASPAPAPQEKKPEEKLPAPPKAPSPAPSAKPEVDEDNNYSTSRLLLLGAAESGKTTLLEQIRILYKQNFSDAELFHRKSFIYHNIVESIRQLINHATKCGVQLSPENQEHVARIFELDDDHFGRFTPEVEKAIFSCWQDPAIQELYKKRSEINLNDSTKYFLDNLSSINALDFHPSPKDLIMSYVPTIGVQNVIFTSNKRSFQLFDIGGQKIDRRKWATMYDGIDAILFCLAVSEYDQVMVEDGETNRLDDSLSLLERIVNEPKFKNTPLFVFLNEIDVFKEKISVIDLKQYRPDYEGSSFNDALNYIEKLVKDRLSNHFGSHIYKTCMIDTEDTGKQLDDVFKKLLKK